MTQLLEPTAALEQLSPESSAEPLGFLESLGAKIDALPEEGAAAPETKPVEPPAPTPETAPVKTSDDLIKEAEANLASGKSPRAPHWEAVKQAKLAAEKERDDYKKQLEELKTAKPSEDLEKKALAEKLQTMEQQHAEYETKIRALDVQQSREFNETVNIPAEAIVNNLKALCAREGIDENAAMEAYWNPDPKARSAALSELSGGLNRVAEMEFLQGANEFSRVQALRHHILSNAPKAWDELQAREASAVAAQKLAERNQWKSEAAKTWDKITEKLADQLKDIPEAVGIRDKVAERDFAAIPVTERAYAIQAGELLPHIVRQNRTMAAKLAEAEKALAKYTAATPGAGPATSSSTPGSSLPAELSFADAVEQRLSGMR